MKKLKSLTITVSLLSALMYMMTYKYQIAFVDTRLMKIPVECLDSNDDGYFDNRDYNFGGINFYDNIEKKIYIMDSKGSIGEYKQCSYNFSQNEFYYIIQSPDCIGYCRINFWIRKKVVK